MNLHEYQAYQVKDSKFVIEFVEVKPTKVEWNEVEAQDNP
jgi:hypothetical protein